VVTCPPNFLSYRLYEVANYATRETFGCVSEGLFMNQDSWNRTPEELKPVIMDVCRNPYRTTKGLNESDYTRMIDRIAEKGVAIYDAAEHRRASPLPPSRPSRLRARPRFTRRREIPMSEGQFLPHPY